MSNNMCLESLYKITKSHLYVQNVRLSFFNKNGQDCVDRISFFIYLTHYRDTSFLRPAFISNNSPPLDTNCVVFFYF